MIKYAHIGFAKSGSTWLQNELFPKHQEIFHLGRFKGDEIIDDDIRLFLWRDIVDTPKFLWNPQTIKNVFQNYFDSAQKQGKRACGISHESFTSPISGKLDVVERAERLRAAMGRDTKIIIIIREQLSWIMSLYTGLLKEGGCRSHLKTFCFIFIMIRIEALFLRCFTTNVLNSMQICSVQKM
jgi:hypothetical protein